MNMHRAPLYLGLLATCLVACTDLLEKDLTGYGVVLLTPPDGHMTSSNVVVFRWEAVPRAEAYRLQLATPDLNGPVQFLADTLIPATSISLALLPGEYQWRVRGENPNSATAYYTRNLTVTEAASLEGMTPVLGTPASGVATAMEPVILTWLPLAGAMDYRVELRTGGATGPLVMAAIAEGTSYEAAGVPEGVYAWGVQAQNATSSSLFSHRSLRVDRTPPEAPVLLAPANGASLPNAPFVLQWQSGVDALTGTADSLYILSSDQQTVLSQPVSGTSWTDSLGPGPYSWYVRTADEAGNITGSVHRTFSIQ